MAITRRFRLGRGADIYKTVLLHASLVILIIFTGCGRGGGGAENAVAPQPTVNPPKPAAYITPPADDPNITIDLQWTALPPAVATVDVERREMIETSPLEVAEEALTEGEGDWGPWVKVESLPPDALAFSDADIGCGKSYEYRVCTVEGNGARSCSAPVRISAPICPPKDLTAELVAFGAIQLTWTDNSENEMWFKIYRKDGPDGQFNQVGSVPADTTSFVDTDIKCGINYQYKVKAANYTKNSGFSNEASDYSGHCNQNGDSCHVLLVDGNANGKGTGLSWKNAYNVIQDAVDAAQPCDQVWVAEGVYTRPIGENEPVLVMKDGVEMYGGFTGYEVSISDREDPFMHPTILDGEEMSYHVVVGASDSKLNGFKVLRGHADTRPIYGGEDNYGGAMYNETIINLIVENCSFIDNSAYDGGGAIYNSNSSVTLKEVDITNNMSSSFGSGILNLSSSLNLQNCTIQLNGAFGGGSGGGVMVSDYSFLIMDNCIIKNNTGMDGGGLMVSGFSNYIISNSKFIENIAYFLNGAGIRLSSSATTKKISNCLFIHNWASLGRGGGIYISSSYTEIINCVFLENWAEGSGGAIYNIGGSPTIRNSILWNNRTSAGNPYLETSDSEIKYEYYGNYEKPIAEYNIIKGGYQGIGNIDMDPQFIDISINNYHLKSSSPAIDSGDPDVIFTDPDGSRNDIGLYGGSTDYFDSDYDGMEDWWEDYWNLDKHNASDSQIDNDDDMYVNLFEFVNNTNPFEKDPKVLFVDQNAIGLNNGKTWFDAFTNIQDAIDSSLIGSEIYVAKGIYKPKDQLPIIQMKQNTVIYGGFTGAEGSLNERGDPSNNPSILQGSGQRIYFVLGASYSIIDGFSITEAYHDDFGSMLNYKNVGTVISNCTFTDNYGVWCAGAVNNQFSMLTIRKCVFTNNSGNYGGAIRNFTSMVNVIDSIFKNNSGSDGGAIYNIFFSHDYISRCKFIQNNSNCGGAIFNFQSSPKIENCLFQQNHSGQGGAIWNEYSSTADIMNCTFFNNSASDGGAISNLSSITTITNSILWLNTANEDPQISDYLSNSIVTYSDILGGYAGVGNIDLFPQFTPDLKIKFASPCRDTGTSTGAPDHDLDNNQRPTGNGYDMGAYEYQWP